MKKLWRKIKKVNWKDLLVRAGKTFWQAAAGAFSVDAVFASGADYKTALRAAVIAAVAAGASAVWNLIRELIHAATEPEVEG